MVSEDGKKVRRLHPLTESDMEELQVGFLHFFLFAFLLPLLGCRFKECMPCLQCLFASLTDTIYWINLFVCLTMHSKDILVLPHTCRVHSRFIYLFLFFLDFGVREGWGRRGFDFGCVVGCWGFK